MSTQTFSTLGPFPAFLSRTNQKANIQEKAKEIAEGLIDPDAKYTAQNPLVIVDGGCGEGDLTVRFLQAIKERVGHVRLLAIDPSPAMTEKCAANIKVSGLLAKNEYKVVTAPFFDHPEGKCLEAETFGKAHIVLCSHALYYANNVAAAVKECNQYMGPDGVSSFIQQSEGSQMHQLRHKYSFTSDTHRQEDGEPNCGKHVRAAIANSIPPMSYTSNLYFPEDYKGQLQLMRNLLTEGRSVEGWQTAYQECAAKHGLRQDADGWASFHATAMVMQFILRRPLDDRTAQPAQVLNFIEHTSALIEGNRPAAIGLPRLIIEEQAVFSTNSAAVEGRMRLVVGAANAAEARTRQLAERPLHDPARDRGTDGRERDGVRIVRDR